MGSIMFLYHDFRLQPGSSWRCSYDADVSASVPRDGYHRHQRCTATTQCHYSRSVSSRTSLSHRHLFTIRIGTVLASFVLAGVFGSLACTFLGDIWGRRWTIFAATATELVGVVLMGSSFAFAQFIVARIILGLGTGE